MVLFFKWKWWEQILSWTIMNILTSSTKLLKYCRTIKKSGLKSQISIRILNFEILIFKKNFFLWWFKTFSFDSPPFSSIILNWPLLKENFFDKIVKYQKYIPNWHNYLPINTAKYTRHLVEYHSIETTLGIRDKLLTSLMADIY